MKLIFAGTPAFAAAALAALTSAGHEIALVLTQPDRLAGRGMQPRSGAVKQAALAAGLHLRQPVSLKAPEIQAELRGIGAQAMVVAAYGLILPAEVLAIPPLGCINIHASLLPRWRGAAPIQRALLAGDRTTGITIMQMDAGLDTGGMLLQKAIRIDDDETALTLHDKLAALGARAIVEALAHPVEPRAQDESQATYAEKITKAEAHIDWTRPTQTVWRQIRAYNPVPGAVTTLAGAALKLWGARPAAGLAGEPGAVLAADAAGVCVGTGDGAIAVTELQLAGGRRLSASAFLAGRGLAVGTRLGS